MKSISAVILSLITSIFITTSAFAVSLSYDFTCSLNTLGGGGCSAGPSFGTITFEDLTGPDAGKVKITVDLGFDDDGETQKFRDLMLNYAGAATSITDDDAGNTVFLSANSGSISPYGGLFDVDGTGGQGWSDGPRTGPYMTVLSGNIALSAIDFATTDSLGNLVAAIHIQDIGNINGGDCDGSGDKPACAPGLNGPGSLKIGATLTELPAPAPMALLGMGIGGLAARRRKKL